MDFGDENDDDEREGETDIFRHEEDDDRMMMNPDENPSGRFASPTTAYAPTPYSLASTSSNGGGAASSAREIASAFSSRRLSIREDELDSDGGYGNDDGGEGYSYYYSHAVDGGIDVATRTLPVPIAQGSIRKFDVDDELVALCVPSSDSGSNSFAKREEGELMMMHHRPLNPTARELQGLSEGEMMQFHARHQNSMLTAQRQHHHYSLPARDADDVGNDDDDDDDCEWSSIPARSSSDARHSPGGAHPTQSHLSPATFSGENQVRVESYYDRDSKRQRRFGEETGEDNRMSKQYHFHQPVRRTFEIGHTSAVGDSAHHGGFHTPPSPGMDVGGGVETITASSTSSSPANLRLARTNVSTTPAARTNAYLGGPLPTACYEKPMSGPSGLRTAMIAAAAQMSTTASASPFSSSHPQLLTLDVDRLGHIPTTGSGNAENEPPPPPPPPLFPPTTSPCGSVLSSGSLGSLAGANRTGQTPPLTQFSKQHGSHPNALGNGYPISSSSTISSAQHHHFLPLADAASGANYLAGVPSPTAATTPATNGSSSSATAAYYRHNYSGGVSPLREVMMRSFSFSKSTSTATPSVSRDTTSHHQQQQQQHQR